MQKKKNKKKKTPKSIAQEIRVNHMYMFKCADGRQTGRLYKASMGRFSWSPQLTLRSVLWVYIASYLPADKFVFAQYIICLFEEILLQIKLYIDVS